MERTKTDIPLKGFALLVFSISLANFMSAIDGTIVTVALPTISGVFNVTPGTASWIITSYVLVMASCVLIFGKISDIIGFKKVFISGFLIFTLGSCAAGFLPVFLDSFPVFIGSRVFQAVGAAMMTAIGPAMVTAYIPMELKGKAMGTVFTLQAFGAAIGPTIGGILTQYLSWSWIFFINIPIGIVAILLGKKVIPEIAAKQWRPGFDRTGAVLIFVGLTSLLFTLSEGQTLGWTSPFILGSLVLTFLAIGAFIWCELSVKDPLLELRLFKERNFLLTNLMVCLLFFCFAGISYLLPFYLEYVQGYTPSVVGLIFSSLSAAIMIGGIGAGVLYNRVKGRRINIAAGIFGVLGYFLITCIEAGTSPWVLVLGLLLIGIGVGSILTSASNMIMNSVSKKYQGMISSFTSLERFIPMMVGITIFNIIFILGLDANAIHSGITTEVFANMQIEELSAGFELSFLVAFIISISILVLAVLAHLKVHPDYQPVGDPKKTSPDLPG